METLLLQETTYALLQVCLAHPHHLSTLTRPISVSFSRNNDEVHAYVISRL